MIRKKFNKKIKGFTLIELIVVMAIFGAIMAAAISLMSPVGKIFQSTAQYEQTRAAVDNTQRYLSGTLRYADRFEMYIQYTDSSTATVKNTIDKTNIESNVASFAGKYFYRGNLFDKLTDPSDTPVYVLVFDNQNYKISKYVFSPKSGKNWINTLNYNDSTGEYSASDWDITEEEYAINEELFKDYGFQVYLGSYEYTTNASGDYALTPQDYSDGYFPTYSNLAFTIVSYKNIKDDTGTVTREPLYQSTSLSFSLVNIIDANTVNELDTIAIPKSDTARYYTGTGFEFDEVSRANINPLDASTGANLTDSFYIIYTLPERVDTYQANNQKSYNYVVTTAATTT